MVKATLLQEIGYNLFYSNNSSFLLFKNDLTTISNRFFLCLQSMYLLYFYIHSSEITLSRRFYLIYLFIYCYILVFLCLGVQKLRLGLELLLNHEFSLNCSVELILSYLNFRFASISSV